MKRLILTLMLLAASAGLVIASGQTPPATSAEPVELKHFVPFSNRAAVTMKSYDEMYMYQELERLFNVDMVFLHPPGGREAEQFNLMMASGDLPDIISYGWIGLPGGPGKYIDDGAIISLNEPMAEGKLPYLKAFYEKYPESYKQAVTDDGTQYMFPFFRPALNLRINGGMAIRYDWMKQVGENDLPETIEDWYRILTKFKVNDVNGNGDSSDEYPLISRKNGGGETIFNTFPTAWKVRKGFHIDIDAGGNKVAYGPAQPGYKDFLAEMAKWYAEGLIDPDYITTDSKGRDAKITSNRAGANYGGMNGNLGKFNTLMKDHPTFDFRGTIWPRANDGVSYTNNTTFKIWTSSGGGAISADSKNKDLAMKVLDYSYGEAGNILANFGEEGVSYTMVNGEPKFSDIILNNPDGLAATNALAQFCVTSLGTAISFAQDPRYATQVRQSIPQQAAAEITWAESVDHLILPPLTPSVEDSTRMTKIMSEVNTYVDEMTTKMIMGLEPMESYGKFLETIKKMGIDEAIEIMQRTYDSYQSR